MPKKEPRKPTVQMRKLNWTKLPDMKVRGTVWEKDAVDERDAGALDTAELEALFGTKAKESATAAADDATETKPAKTKVELVAIVDPKRAQAISTVMGNLKSMKLDVDMCIAALLTADLSQLDNPRMPIEMVLTLIHNAMPTAEEIEQIEAYDGPREMLRDVEKWLLQVREQLPHYAQRAEALVARAAFANAYADEFATVRRVHETASQIYESHTLQRLLARTLALGNYLNGTSRQGGAYGFKLGALAELTSCKSVDGQLTLLHYLAKTTASMGSDGGALVNQLKKELSAFDDPVRFEWQSSAAEVSKLVKSIQSMDALVLKDEVDAFKTNMSEFLADARQKTAALEKLSSDTVQLCVDLGTWFAEQKVDKEPEKFFAMVGAFVKALEGADRSLRDKEEREEKKRQRALHAAKEAEARLEAKAAGKAAGGALDDKTNLKVGGRVAVGGARKNLVDNVVEGMAQGRVRRHG